MSKTLTFEALWFGGNSELTAILNILLSYVLALEMRRTRFLTVLIKSFRIGILHELLELPSDVGFHLRIFIIRRLISLITFGLQCYALAFASFPNSSKTQLIGLQFANQLHQRNRVDIL